MLKVNGLVSFIEYVNQLKPDIMNTCITCKYWGDGRKVEPNKHNVCGKIEIDDSETFKPTDMAFIDVQVDDDSNLNVKFETLGNFGCSLHSLKQ